MSPVKSKYKIFYSWIMIQLTLSEDRNKYLAFSKDLSILKYPNEIKN